LAAGFAAVAGLGASAVLVFDAFEAAALVSLAFGAGAALAGFAAAFLQADLLALPGLEQS
jgi:hypothetical protein